MPADKTLSETTPEATNRGTQIFRQRDDSSRKKRPRPASVRFTAQLADVRTFTLSDEESTSRRELHRTIKRAVKRARTAATTFANIAPLLPRVTRAGNRGDRPRGSWIREPRRDA